MTAKDGKKDASADQVPWPEGSKQALEELASKQQNWLATPERRILRCLAAALYKRGVRGRKIAEGVKLLVPNYQGHFERPISDQAISARGYNAWFYEKENPDKSDPIHWKIAKKIVERESAVDLADVVKHAERA